MNQDINQFSILWPCLKLKHICVWTHSFMLMFIIYLNHNVSLLVTRESKSCYEVSWLISAIAAYWSSICHHFLSAAMINHKIDESPIRNCTVCVYDSHIKYCLFYEFSEGLYSYRPIGHLSFHAVMPTLNSFGPRRSVISYSIDGSLFWLMHIFIEDF